MRPLARSLLGLALLAGSPAPAEECGHGIYDRVTDDFYFSASSAQGASGDVVPVDVLLTVETLHEGLGLLTVTGCYDPALAELAAEVEFSPTFDSVAYRQRFRELEEGGVRGFNFSGILLDERVSDVFGRGEPVHIATLYFRILGEPGTSFPVAFCDEAFHQPFNNPPPRPCWNSHLSYATSSTDRLRAFSTRHVPAEIRIIEGDPTNPEPPPLPPLARVYPEAPTPESAAIHFELSGAVAQPGSAEVPMDLHVTSNYEFSGFALSVTFPPEYLELARVAHHTRPGAERIDNQAGHLSVAMLNSRRRVGAEGERLKLVTLYFNVKPEASLVQEVAPAIGDYAHDGLEYFNWLAIHHTDGQVSADALPVTAEVSPLEITNRKLRIQREGTYPGDVNLDYTVDISDAVAILGHLFRGEEGVVCPPAADFNGDERVNITDPIAILTHLFLSEKTRVLEPDVFCDG